MLDITEAEGKRKDISNTNCKAIVEYCPVGAKFDLSTSSEKIDLTHVCQSSLHVCGTENRGPTFYTFSAPTVNFQSFLL